MGQPPWGRDALLEAGTLDALDAAWLLRKLEAAVEAVEALASIPALASSCD